MAVSQTQTLAYDAACDCLTKLQDERFANNNGRNFARLRTFMETAPKDEETFWEKFKVIIQYEVMGDFLHEGKLTWLQVDEGQNHVFELLHDKEPINKRHFCHGYDRLWEENVLNFPPPVIGALRGKDCNRKKMGKEEKLGLILLDRHLTKYDDPPLQEESYEALMKKLAVDYQAGSREYGEVDSDEYRDEDSDEDSYDGQNYRTP